MQQQLCDGLSRPIYMHHLDGSWESSSRHMIPEGMSPDGVYHKQDFIEIFSVRFVNHKKLDFSNIYGAIVMQVGIRNYILFNRKLGEPPCIDSEGFVTLRMPCHGIKVGDGIELQSYLFNLEMKTRSKFVEWWSKLSYDNVLSQRVGSMFGPIEVTLAAYFSAVVASLEVTLINFEDECLSEVYGHVKVKNNKTLNPRAVSWLFRKENKGTMTCISPIKSGRCIALPLLRHVVAVPIDSTMMVDVCICYGDTVFASGEVMFHAKLTGKESGFLIGSHGKIRVEVLWSRVTYYDKLGYSW
ncbi:rRNA N-glycosidase [Rhynchospora pubera]|uniref:rRNA N-glycosidase n=1 Tax=Rhynchospora pubera TaxID=906938 RepID=A0AAV8BS91_9POAL|nr:rRNA N-glycosidase [Rhynchospora pubera]KAJ4801175.1 rRNA N-glycosidase [Rhynchospora pubera]